MSLTDIAKEGIFAILETKPTRQAADEVIAAMDTALLLSKLNYRNNWIFDLSNFAGVVESPASSSVAISVGDLLYQESCEAFPASHQTDQGSKLANQNLFASKFLGIALEPKPVGSAGPIRVATRGVFWFSCSLRSFELGDLIGSDSNTGNDGLENQIVAKVATAKYAIGRVCKHATNATTVRVEIVSTVMAGGIMGSSYVPG
jgi:hypothetical protein